MFLKGLRDKFSDLISKITDKVSEKKNEILKQEVVIKEKHLKILDDYKLLFLEADVAYEVSERILNDIKRSLLGKRVKRKDVEKVIKESIYNVLDNIIPNNFNLIDYIKSKEKKPFIILFLGINGSGKTLTLVKVANLLKKNNLSCVIAASDTFRAAAIEQLEKLASKINVRVIKHKYGADPAAVAFDAIKHAESRRKDVVLIDTAGRMETDEDLLREMEKIARVTKSDFNVLVIDSTTGNVAYDIVTMFSKYVRIDGVIVTKTDVDTKGGCILTISYLLKKPIIFITDGQELEDIKAFDKRKFLNELISSSHPS